MKIEERFIQIESGCLFVKQWTPQTLISAEPLILLHDSLGSVAQWRDFPNKLANVLLRQVIAYDRLGFGKSSGRTEIPSTQFIEEEAELYFPLMKSALGINKFLLLGHSVGGAMAVNIAATDGDCTCVITVSAQAFVEELTLNGIKAAKSEFKDQEVFNKISKWHGDKAQWVLNAWTDVWLSPEFRDWKLLQTKNVDSPLLAIHGDEDEYGSVAFPKYLAGNTKGESKIEKLAGCGHMPHVTHTTQTISAIERFINEVG